MLICSHLLDYLIYLNSPGCTTASIFIVAVGYAKNKGVAIGLLCMGVGVTGLNATGYAVNILDIAPKYAGVIIGISNVFGSMPGFISPQIVGFITTKNVSNTSQMKISADVIILVQILICLFAYSPP